MSAQHTIQSSVTRHILRRSQQRTVNDDKNYYDNFPDEVVTFL